MMHGIFSYVGYAITQGKAMYKEVWDNKGPVLYIIYALGQIINESYGVYALELISILITVLFVYKTAKIITEKRIYSIVALIYTFSVWGVTYEGGTFCENFALPLLMIRSVFIYKNDFHEQVI